MCLTLINIFWEIHPNRRLLAKVKREKNKTEINQSSQSRHYNHLLIQSIRQVFTNNAHFKVCWIPENEWLLNLGIDRFLIIAEHSSHSVSIARNSAQFLATQIFYLLLIFYMSFPYFLVFHPSIVHTDREHRVFSRKLFHWMEKYLTANEWDRILNLSFCVSYILTVRKYEKALIR